MMRAAIVSFVLVAGISAASDGGKPEFFVSARKRAPYQQAVTVVEGGLAKTVTRTLDAPLEFSVKLDPSRTAVVVCDMWDDHWCKSAAARCGELAKKADPVLNACREKGMTIIHCPSDTMAFYKDHPARKRMLAVKKVDPPKAKDLPSPPLPVDDSDGGCDDATPAKQFKAWSRQNAALTIDEAKDYVTDNGNEVYSLLAEKKIDTLLVMGVHTNMCVLNRTFAIKQMVKWGKTVYLIRDLTDAMYNPKMKPMVSHEKGTELIIEYIERYWCPSIESRQLTGK
jgi:nicotinamidase-related amidase